jgi:CRISPR-associated protein Cas2
VVVIIVGRVSESLRGELTRWLLEPRACVFVGSPSAMVRDRLWTLVCQKARGGAATMIHTSDSEQGFEVRLWGSPNRAVVDFDGLWLVNIKTNQ